MKKILINSTMVGNSMLATLIDIKLKKLLENNFKDMKKFTWEITFKADKYGNNV